MVKSKRKISGLVTALISALILSGSFCLHVITMTVLADFQPSKTNSVSNINEMPSMNETSSINEAASSCCQGCQDQNNPAYHSPLGHMLNCCALDQLQTITSSGTDLSQGLIVSPLVTIPVNIYSDFGNLKYTTVIMPPPQNVCLRSIVKNE